MAPRDIIAAPVHRSNSVASRPACRHPALLALAERVAEDGVEAHHDALIHAIAATDLSARSPLLVAIAVDATAPPIARARAVGALASTSHVSDRAVEPAPATPAAAPLAA